MKTHWKKLVNPNYLGVYSLPESGELTLKIIKVEKEMVKGTEGKEEQCMVCYVEGNKPLILNKTNAKIIQRNTGSAFIEDWQGKTITLYSAKVKAFGDTVDALRVKAGAATELPALTPESKFWQNVLDKFQSQEITLAQIKQKFTVSPETERILCG